MLLSAAGAPAFATDIVPRKPPQSQDFYFTFTDDNLSGGGSISGSGILVAEPLGDSPGKFLVTNVLDGAADYNGSTYGLALLPRNGYPTPVGQPPLSNDNVLDPNSTPQLDSLGISFAVGGLGDINIADGNYTFTTNFAGAGTGNFQASPGPSLGTGLLALAFLIIAGTLTSARRLSQR
ncbi:hypothetical protein [Methylocystis bryophila]|nr:hypothetical protein [Methylocystis bryophila]BDV37844.1 hypothetical protein DSM21852_10970 [Methylocystis bryophila]